MVVSETGHSKSYNPYLERRWVLCFAGLVMLVTTLPYFIGFANQGVDWQFSGFVFGVEDGNSYIAKMLSGANGDWLFRTPYTAYPQNGVVAFLPYILLGKLAAPPGLHVQLVVLFHLFRVGSGILAILATFDFVSFFLSDIRIRWFALVLAVLGGGLGWIAVLIGRDTWMGSLPLEFYSPETFGFLELYGLPHLSMARATFFWGLLVYLRSTSEGVSSSRRSVARGRTAFHSGLIIGVLWLFTALAQPLTALILGWVIGLHLLALTAWQLWRRFKSREPAWNTWWNTVRVAIWAGIIPAPFLLYNALAFTLDPFLKVWTMQNRIISPHPIHYLLAYGLLIPFAFIGARSLIDQNPWPGWLLTAWTLSVPVLAYAPFNLQRRLPEGVWIALVILAVKPFDRSISLVGKAPDKKSTSANLTPALTLPHFRLRRRLRLLLLMSFPSTLLLIAGGIITARHQVQPVFQPVQEVDAYKFLNSEAKKWDVVLTSYETGNTLPAWAAVRVVIGHGPESAGLVELKEKVLGLYQTDTDDSDRFELIREFGIRYIFWGPAERALGEWDPGDALYLQQVFRVGMFAIYEVKS